jgi:site-specific DNA-methyltransferase (adenine-specific)
VQLISATDWKSSCSLPPNTIICGDALATLSKLPSASVQTVVTSPPYFGIRDYQHENQIGLEATLPEYFEKLAPVFCEVRRVLKDDGVLWLNIADGHTSGNRKSRAPDKKNPARAMSTRPPTPKGLKPKDLLGIPWRLALMLQNDGWYLRNEITWHKQNAMRESVRNRQMRSHEYVFMLTKSERYLFINPRSRKLAVNSGDPFGR